MSKQETSTPAVGAAKNEKAEKPKKFTKKTEALIILLSVAFSFTLFFFPAADIFMGNQREFIVSFKTAAVPMLLTALTGAAALIVLLNLLLLIWKPLYTFVSRLLFGTMLAGYLQALLLNGRMVSLTGADAKYNDHSFSTIMNMVIFITVAVLPLILSILGKLLPKNKLLHLGDGMAIPYISAVVLIMQFAGTMSSFATADFSKYNKQYTSYLSYKPAMSLSEEGNIVVFLTDRLDSNWMDDMLDKYPEVNEKLDGFTFYQNNVAHSTSTFPSVPQMLTMNLYDGQEWADYISKSWEGDTVSKILTENGYDANLLIDSLTTYGSIGQLEGQCANICECSKDDFHINYLGEGGIVPTMTRLSLSRLAPYSFKSDITNGLGADLSSRFVVYDSEIEDQVPMTVGAASDIAYYDYLRSHGLNADNDNKTFTFTHLNGFHDTNRDIIDLYDKDEPTSNLATGRGDFEILFEYFQQMKELGVYDNSTIIIMGDHGRAPVEIEKEHKDGLDSAITTGILIKPAGSASGPLEINSTAELSNDFFGASIIDYAGLDYKELCKPYGDYYTEYPGYSYREIYENDLHVDRYMQTYLWGGYGKVTYKTLYKITGNARDFDNWEAQPDHE